MRPGLSFVVALALCACGSKSSEPEPTGSGSAGTAAAVATGTHMFVDDKDVATVTAAQVATWPRVDSFLPESARRLGKWQAISIKNAKPQPSTLDKPFEAHRDYIPIRLLFRVLLCAGTNSRRGPHTAFRVDEEVS